MPKWLSAATAVVTLTALLLAVASALAWRPSAPPAAGQGPAPRQVILSGIESIAGNVRLATHIGTPLPPSPQCPGQGAVWDDSDQRPTVVIFLLVAQCMSLETARDAQWSRVNSAKQGEGTIGLPPAVPYAWQGQGTPYVQWPAGQMQQLIFRRGTYYVEITGYVATSRGGDASSLIRAVAVAQSRRLTGAPGPGAESFRTAEIGKVFPQASVLTFLALAVWLFAGFVRRRRREPRARTTRPGGAAFDVTAVGRRAARMARWSAVWWRAWTRARSWPRSWPSETWPAPVTSPP